MNSRPANRAVCRRPPPLPAAAGGGVGGGWGAGCPPLPAGERVGEWGVCWLCPSGGLAASASEQPLCRFHDPGAIEAVARVHVGGAAAATVSAGPDAEAHQSRAQAVFGNTLRQQRAEYAGAYGGFT